MPKGPRLISVLILLGWLFAVGHVALEHGGIVDGGAAHTHAAGGNEGGFDDGTPADDGDHHHDLTALSDRGFAKTREHQASAPVWVPLDLTFVERLTARLREEDESHVHFDFGSALLDARASGWLWVLQTARPVRGPSFI